MKNLKEIILPPELSARLTEIYTTMQLEYDRIAKQMGLTCTGCSDNCCDSYFLHYTYAEWAYLWEGLRLLDQERIDRITDRAVQYQEQSRKIIARGERPQLMCPLNEDGLCVLYNHRLMICRMHGVPASMTRPDGKALRFPGCFRCQEIVEDKYQPEEDVPVMDRTILLRKIAQLESELLEEKRHLFPKVKHTIAEMIGGGPPQVDKPFCER
jgi:hypothetical protein